MGPGLAPFDHGMEEAIIRGWLNLIHRLDGPLHFRFIVQPLVATLLAIRAGMRDARAGEPPFLVALRCREQRRDRLRAAWGDIGQVFVVALAVDAIYQVAFEHAIYLLELVVTATLLALVPYAIVRGPARRAAGAWLTARARA
jgi:hypothetical protein